MRTVERQENDSNDIAPAVCALHATRQWQYVPSRVALAARNWHALMPRSEHWHGTVLHELKQAALQVQGTHCRLAVMLQAALPWLTHNKKDPTRMSPHCQ